VPFVNVKAVRGVMTDAERERLVERLTDVVVELFARGWEQFRPNIWVVVEEASTSGGRRLPTDLPARRTG
jgi:phenylpyruvate tautomerase PptA (4-oxalocrotonate tautomerase family)